ncbi:uroporphyrinogen-III C-methyltransferase [Cardiobacteriaceae bacterium TAE3-ERU3]|nr:uroporphyrinogen-III C-methyltransferase [Cardiobacteriaceae bacterium TAE3-ERU3]
MSSKNNKPVNNPANKDKKPQTTSASGPSKSASNKVDQNSKPVLENNKPQANNTKDNKTPAEKSSVANTATSGANNSSAALASNADKGNNKSSDTLAKPIPPNSKPVSAAKPTTSSTTPNKEAEKKAADSKPTNASANNKGNGTPPPTPPSKNGPSKRSPLPLIISLIALGVSGYALYSSMQQAQSNPEEVQKLQEQIAQLQSSIAEKTNKGDVSKLDESIKSLENQVGELKSAPAQGLGEAQIQSLIAEQVDQAKQSLQESATSQPQQAGQPTLSKEQVSTMIKEALISSADGGKNAQPAIDLSSEINAIKQNKAEIEQYLEQIKQQGESLKSALSQTAEQAQSNLSKSVSQAEQKITAADQQPIVYPLINTLTLAEVASNAHQFGLASQYLQQAKASFDDLHLNQQPYAQFAGQIEELAQKTKALAKQQNSQQEIDNMINSVGNWPFISTDPENVLDNKPSNKPTESWKDDIKHIGNSILSSTVTITKNDAAGLTWVNENPHLQEIIRENVRLDLAMIRNALLVGDQERAQQIAATLHDRVAHYFDTNAEQVKQAMNQLSELTQQQNDKPDIAALIKSIQQAG